MKFSLTTDGWTVKGGSQQAFVGVTMHYMSRPGHNRPWKLEAISLDLIPSDGHLAHVVLSRVLDGHSAANMRDDILDSLKQFGLPRPYTVTTDNASAAVALAKELVGPARSVGCAAHMLQLSVKLAIEVAVVVASVNSAAAGC